MMSSSSTTVSFSSISYFYLYLSLLQIISPFFILLRPLLFQSIPLLLLLLLLLPSQPLPLSTSFTTSSSLHYLHNLFLSPLPSQPLPLSTSFTIHSSISISTSSIICSPVGSERYTEAMHLLTASNSERRGLCPPL